jgi:MFS family permease
VSRLLLFFSFVYAVEGLGQVEGLIAQPLSFYLKQEHGWTPLQVSAYLTIFNFPWIIKPVYGVFSDFVPLFGYRRKGYLIAANIVAVGAFLWATQLNTPSQLVWALQVTAYAMAISSTVCGAMLVENGQRLGESGRFVNQQWLWFNVAAMASAIGGGALAQLGVLQPVGKPVSGVGGVCALSGHANDRLDTGQIASLERRPCPVSSGAISLSQ